IDRHRFGGEGMIMRLVPMLLVTAAVASTAFASARSSGSGTSFQLQGIALVCGGHVDSVPRLAVSLESSPQAAVLDALDAYVRMDETAYADALTADYRFVSDDPDFVLGAPRGLSRQEELATLAHLVHGVTRASGESLPALRRAGFAYDSLRVLPGSGVPVP